MRLANLFFPILISSPVVQRSSGPVLQRSCALAHWRKSRYGAYDRVVCAQMITMARFVPLGEIGPFSSPYNCVSTRVAGFSLTLVAGERRPSGELCIGLNRSWRVCDD